jgi:hypothetical protein
MEVAEEMMALKVPWKIIQGSTGQIHDSFSFDTQALFIHLVTNFGLEGKAKKGELVLNYSHSRTPLVYAHRRTYKSKPPESHSTQDCAGACVLCLKAEPKYY